MSTLRAELVLNPGGEMERRVDRAYLQSHKRTTVHVDIHSAEFEFSEGLHRRLTNDHAPQLRSNRRKWYELYIAPNNILTPIGRY